MKVGIKSAFNKKRIFIAVLVLVILAVMVISNPWTIARQTPLSMGFSRLEH